MPYLAIEKTLSISRFSTYRTAILGAIGDDCHHTALELYEWNANLSSALFFPLHIYEVVLRNAISDAISCRYPNDWPTNIVFQNSLSHFDRSYLIGLLDNYSSIGKLLPEIKLAWWENILTRRHDGRIWKDHIMSIFPNTTETNPETLRLKLNRSCRIIRKIRNRVAHHEPIFNQPDLQSVYPYIEETIAWRCNDTVDWLKRLERATSILNSPVL